MSTRFAWVLGLLTLISVGFLIACGGSHFSASSDGLLIVPSQGSDVIQTFSFNLSNGHSSAINNPPATPNQSLPATVVLDPAGSFAYVVVYQNPTVPMSVTGVATYGVNSNGTLSAIGMATLNAITENDGTTAPANPVALAVDSAGKFLFVADGVTTGSLGTQEAGAVSVFSIGSNASLTEIAGSPFIVPSVLGGTPADLEALAITPTVFPSLNAACSGQTPSSTEYLYVADSANNELWGFSVDPAAGSLTALLPVNPTALVPSAVAVDACNRFVYVANQQSNNVNGYTICSITSSTCPNGPGSLVSVASPYPAGNGPVAIAVDPLANFVYVVNKLSNSISSYRISQVTGALSGATTTTTGATPVAIVIRSDDSWLFVSNYGGAGVSQYALTPASGGLTPQSPIATDNFPWGVAVK